MEPDAPNPHPHTLPPPGAWEPVRDAVRLVTRPVEQFLRIQAASGIVLLLCAVAAVAWANSPWQASYLDLWHTHVSFHVGSLHLERDLHFVINDILMVLFFFVVGLEIRRELYHGELSEFRRALLPAAAAAGGMVVPALIYAGINLGSVGTQGWGVPMATDIAFAVGLLALLGSRVPAALRVLLLALAIIDDIGAVLVIALFYSTGGDTLIGLSIVSGGIAGVLLFQRLGVRSPWAYVPLAVVVWGGFLEAGIHPTIAGVVLGLLTPARSWYGEVGFLAEAEAALGEFRRTAAQAGHDHHDLAHALDRIQQARREALPPAVRLELALNPWVAFGVMPIFALANAGVTLGTVDFSQAGASPVALGATAGLLFGKPIGILTASWLAVRAGLCQLPKGVDLRGLAVIGLMGGIGFTMALFIGHLAFAEEALLGAAKLGVLLGSGLAGLLGLAAGWVLLPRDLAPGAARSADESERSTEL